MSYFGWRTTQLNLKIQNCSFTFFPLKFGRSKLLGIFKHCDLHEKSLSSPTYSNASLAECSFSHSFFTSGFKSGQLLLFYHLSPFQTMLFKRKKIKKKMRFLCALSESQRKANSISLPELLSVNR